jgi:hypothetical protein
MDAPKQAHAFFTARAAIVVQAKALTAGMTNSSPALRSRPGWTHSWRQTTPAVMEIMPPTISHQQRATLLTEALEVT